MKLVILLSILLLLISCAKKVEVNGEISIFWIALVVAANALWCSTVRIALFAPMEVSLLKQIIKIKLLILKKKQQLIVKQLIRRTEINGIYDTKNARMRSSDESVWNSRLTNNVAKGIMWK